MTKTFKQLLLAEEHLNESRVLLESVCKDLTEEQRSIVENIHREFRPLIEASLTPDQINQLFTGVEQQATAAGGNRTAIGQGKDVIAKANEIINSVGKWLQDTKPVQAFDQKFEQLKNKINTKFPDSKILDGISQMGVWAEKNPGKTAAIIGVLTALASLAGGPVGGAIAGQVLRGANELLKGEKLSTAIGKGAKSAVMGFLAGKALEYVSDAVVSNTVASGEEAIKQTEAAMKAANYQDALDTLDPSIKELIPELNGTMSVDMQGTYNNFRFSYDVILTPAQQEQFQAYQDAISSLKVFSPEEMAKTIEFHNWMNSIQQDPNQTMLKVASDALKEIENSDVLTVEQLTSLVQQHENLEQTVNALYNAGGAVSAAVQGAVTAAEQDKQNAQKAGPPNTAPGATPTPEGLRENQIRKLFYTVERKSMVLDEGIGDALKGAAGKAAGKLQQVGKNLTTKVTADKLMKAWKAAGSPTDSDQVAEILRSAGVDDSIITSTYQSMKIPAPAAPAAAATNAASTGTSATSTASTGGTPAATAKDIIAGLAKLDKKGKQRLMAYLQKQLGTA